MKSTCKPRFEYISSLDPDFAKGYRKYYEMMNQTKQDLADIYYELEDEKKVLDFGRYLFKNKVYGNENSFGTGAPKKIFSSRDGFGSYKGYITALETIRYYELYLEERENENRT